MISVKQAEAIESFSLFFVKILYLFITVNYDGLLATGRIIKNGRTKKKITSLPKVKGDFDLDIIEIM